MVGGFYWDTGDTDKVFALDMEEPLKDGVLLKERLVKSILLFLSLYVSSFFGIKMFCRVPPTGLCTHHAVWRGGHSMCWGLRYGGSKLQESSCFRDTNEFHPPTKCYYSIPGQYSSCRSPMEGQRVPAESCQGRLTALGTLPS